MDLDRDGDRDVVSGSWPGEIHLFRGDGEGGFDEGTALRDAEKRPVHAGKASSVAVADWDRDGDLDLVVGNIDGQIHLVPNTGVKGGLVFAPSVRLQVERKSSGKWNGLTSGDSGPCVDDWDGDGVLDLLVGTGDGSVIYFRGTGASGMPELAEGIELVPAMQTGGQARQASAGEELEYTRPSMRTKIAVADWNADGRKDLLVGDFASETGPEPALTHEQKLRRSALETELEHETSRQAVLRERNVYPRVREELGMEPASFPGDDLVDRFYARAEELEQQDIKLVKLGERLEAIWAELRPLQPTHITRGFVWVYLRKPESSQAPR